MSAVAGENPLTKDPENKDQIGPLLVVVGNMDVVTLLARAGGGAQAG